MKAATITLKSMKTSRDFKVVKLVNTMRFSVGDTIKEAEAKRLVNTPSLKVIIV